MKKTSCVLAVTLLAQTFQPAHAQSIEEWDFTAPDVMGINSENNPNGGIGAADFSEALFVGSSSNNNIAAGTLNDVFAVDTNNTFQSILSGQGVWGATADTENQRVLFTQSSEIEPPEGAIGGGDNLYELPYAGGTPVLLGRITLAGEGLRLDGLAMRKGILYGFNAGNGAVNGFYRINLTTFEASLIANLADSIGGLDADPETCIIYGTNDTTGQVITMDTSGNVTDLAPYPVGIVDIDGLAVGEGYAYLVTDEDQDISVLNLDTLQYETPLNSPFAASDTFSAGALAIQVPVSQSDALFKSGFEVDYCIDSQ
jgi:hypothetical protein